MPLVLNDKHLDLLSLAVRPDTSLLVLEGTVRSSKTVIVIQAFYLRVKQSKTNLHCIGGKDYDAIRDNVLDCDGLGLLHLFPDVRLIKPKLGSYYLTMRGYDGQTKVILLAGYSNTKQWEKILGKTIECFLIDEVNIANKTFIDETFARQVSTEHPFTIWTLNGDTPDHFIYQDYINYAKPLWKVPASILTDMNAFPNRKGWYYTHWVMEDNPVMTPEKIERASSIYPFGSYYYTIKILGERGAPEGSIFAQYLDNSFFSKDIEAVIGGRKVTIDEIEYNLKYNHYIKLFIGIDLGNNDAKRGTILTLTGVTRGYKNVDVIDVYQAQSTESEALVAEICNVIVNWHSELMDLSKMNSIRIDGFGAVQVLIPTIRKKLISMKCRTLTDLAIKFGEDGGRRARLDLVLLLISQHRLRFNSKRKGAKELAISMRKLRYDKDGLPLDTNQVEMDYYDSFGYTLTPMTHDLTNAMR